MFDERRSRWHPDERRRGWHAQYDHVASGQSFLRDPATLDDVSGEAFDRKYVIERLSGIGVFEQPPAWATPPRPLVTQMSQR